MEYNIVYKSSIKKDIKKVNKRERLRILNEIENVLKSAPLKGKELKGEFRGISSYRIGDYRVIYTVLGSTILILRINHRKNAYK